MSDADRCLLYFHIPRTGGTWLRQSIIAHLVKNCQPDQIYFVDGVSEWGCAHGSYEELRRLPAHQRSRLRLVAGHMPADVLDLLPDAISVTVMRDPVERSLSDYWFCYHDSTNPAHPFARALSPLEFCRQGYGQARNGHAKYLSGAAYKADKFPDDLLLEHAAHNLKRFSLVGHHDRLQALASAVEQVAGLHGMAMTGSRNAVDRLKPVTSDESAALRNENWVDYQLYGSEGISWVG